MNILINKGFIFSAALVVAGVLGLADSASASYNYNHDSRNSYKFDSYSNGHHGNSRHGYHNNSRTQRHYRKRYNRQGYSSKHRSYNKGYGRNHSYGYHDGNSYRQNKKHYKRQRRNHQGYSNHDSHDRRYNSHDSYDQGYSSHDSHDNRKYSPKISSHCYSYKVKTHGGRGGFRFQHDKDAFKRIDKRGYVSKICGHDSVEFELSKVDPGVSVSIEINGKHFNYPANSGHDRYINNWHRKYFSVNFKGH